MPTASTAHHAAITTLTTLTTDSAGIGDDADFDAWCDAHRNAWMEALDADFAYAAAHGDHGDAGEDSTLAA